MTTIASAIQKIREQRAAEPPAEKPSNDRLYFVYREDSTLPLLSGWRDKEAALQYAKDSNAHVVLGVDVTYLAEAPFDQDDPS